MIRTVVPDASVVVEQLITGDGALSALSSAELIAPSVLPYEVSNVIRKLWTARSLPAEQERELVWLLRSFPVMYWPWEMIAERVWELRDNLTSTDASYVAVAELAGAVLVTKDRRMAAAPGIRCAVEVMP
ncbi:MAG: type II toxin-antitoxin system VapC family toxin [Humibacter sp.]